MADAIGRGWSYQDWLAHVAEIPCAAYVIRNDSSLTLLGGNQAFYRLYDCSEQEIRQKYGGRMSALMDAEPLKALPPCGDGPAEAVEIRQRICHGGRDIRLVTGVLVFPCETGSVLCCVSTDVTAYEAQLASQAQQNETVRLTAEQAGMDYMEYDYATAAAQFFCADTVLPAALAEESGICRDFVARMIAERIVAPDQASLLRKAFRRFAETEKKATCELQLRHAVRGEIWVRLCVVQKADGAKAVATWEDITQEKEAAHNYLNETLFYQAILADKDAYGHVDVTEDRITRVGGMWNLYNEVIDKITYSQLTQEFIYKVVHPDDRKQYLEVMQRENFIQSLGNGIDRLGCEFRRIVEQNKMVWMRLSVYLFRDPLTRHVVGLLTIENINEEKRQEMLLRYDSSVDQLTHVYNRRMAEFSVREALSQMDPDALCAFLVLDIDDFKQINDGMGHHEGDLVLVRLADCLSHFFRQDDVVGRFGGDEFIIFLPHAADRASVQARIDQLYAQLQAGPGDGDRISCSAGIALGRQNTPYEALFRQADMALYQAKSAGKGQFLFYDNQACPEDRRGFVAQHPVALPADAAAVERVALGSAPSAPDARESFDLLIGEQGDIAYLINPENFDLICCNQAFYDRLGMSVTQCAGMKCYEAMHKRDKPCPFCSRANWAHDKFYLWRNLNTTLEQEFLIKNKLVSWRGKDALLAIAVDISNDKSIVDSMDNSAMESHSLLSGVQHMAEAKTLCVAVESALETVGNFFRADAVGFWQHDPAVDLYVCRHCWGRKGQTEKYTRGSSEVHEWLVHRTWDQGITLESPEAMLNHSYTMYLYMKEQGVHNQQWMRIDEADATLGFLMIDNSSSNLQNVAFLESFSVFFANELRKRSLIESAIYAGQHDDLTDLLSRKSFEEFTAEYVSDRLVCIGVLMANLNNLKGINSSRGFQTGNYFISKFADMLRHVFGGNKIFRLNGDEFLVILPEVTRTALDSDVAALEALIAEDGLFTASIGYSWDNIENDLSALIEQATQAMKVHKKRHYDAMPDLVDLERRKMIKDLVASIENREFEVFLQPKVELLHGHMVGAEALIRYHHKEAGYILPAQFIDILEKNNLIRFIDLFVFEEVCKLLERWKRQGRFLPVVSLNFSRLTLLERDILENMESIISRYDVPKKHVEIEITESVTCMGKSILYQAAQDMYAAGYAISLDDFGTKYTNLAILADLDFSILKVDKSIVGELGATGNHKLIMKNIISMCQDLDIGVLAEGVETQDQEDILQALNCQLGQGYLYGKPMPIAEFDQKYMQGRHAL